VDENAPIVAVDRLTHRYRERIALDGVSFEVAAGEIVGLLGPNGSGKSTLFKALSTLITPAGGAARVCGHDVVQAPDLVRRCIGVVFQNPSLDKKLTARENLTHQGHMYGLRGGPLRERIASLLGWVGLQERAGSLVETFSGGMVRRVEVAKAMLHEPQLLLLDEPGAGLDPGARRETWNMLCDLRESRGATILFTTHLMDEADSADRLVILDQGRVVAVGTPSQLRSQVGGDVVRIEAADAQELASDVRQRFGGEPRVLDGAVYVERPDGFAFVPQLVEAFPGRIASVAVGKPTLEDVFMHHTGRRLYDGFEDEDSVAFHSPQRRRGR